nr:unnamed protein product [Digitaria exilis]
MLMALHLAAATAVLLPGAPTIGKPGCATMCGNVSVPYPFGLSPGCYWPGLNLTCDTSHGGTPRLLLGDGTLRVTEISLENATVRVMRAGAIINATGDFISNSWNVSFGHGFTEYGYKLSYANELVVSGCNAVAWILADIGENHPGTIIGGCASLCTVLNHSYGPIMVGMESSKGKYCNGVVGCCQASFNVGGPHSEVQAKWLNSGNHTKEQQLQPLIVFVTEAGWVDKNGRMVASELEEVPIVLAWSVTQGLPQHDDNWCPDDIRRTLCKSQHSQCSVAEQQGYMCSCEEGYDGNPYLPGGCQDIDECKLPSEENGCFGECINTMGSMECWCPHRTFGNPGVKGGCVRINDSNTDALPLPTVAPVRLVLHDYCNSSCGDVRVPYPFGISPGCYMPGFNLTCNKSYNPPRLLLDSDGILEVVNISLLDSMVHVVRHAMAYTNPTHVDATTVYFYIPNISEPYTLSTKNELIFYGCNMQAILYGECSNDSTVRIISSCNSTCSSNGNYIVYEDGSAGSLVVPAHSNRSYCSGRDDGCCHASVAAGSTPKKMDFNRLNLDTRQKYHDLIAVAFVSEVGMTDQWHMTLNRTDLSSSELDYISSPLVLRWAVKQGFPASLTGSSSGQCPREVANILCRSEPSSCRQENGGFTCYCPKGYLGNPYVVSGCQVIDECQMVNQSGKQCFGNCINIPGGGHECRCPRGYFGNPSKPGGCTPTGDTQWILS